MPSLEEEIRQEIVAVHRFFVAWFNGTVAPDELETIFVSRLDNDVVFVSPDGHVANREGLLSMFRAAHGNNPAFRIEIRDVKLLREWDDHALATYSEWQRNATSSAKSDNARFSTVLLRKSDPFQWLHIHETWLPAAIADAGPYDF